MTHTTIPAGDTTCAKFEDETLKDDAGVRTLVTSQQKAFQKTHGSSAVALMVAMGYIAIRKIRANAPAAVQAAILDEHGVAEATGGTSKYTPWIKVQWGEQHLDPAKTFTDSLGVERRQWVADRSMEIYHHTMEELEELGVETDDPKKVQSVILKHGGASKMARKRQTALNELAKPAKEQTAKEKRDVFLEETSGPIVDIVLDCPADAGEYWTLLVRPISGSQGFEILGVVSHDAAATLDKMASDQFDALTQKRKEREREAKHREALEASRKAGEQRILGGLDAEQRRALLERLAKSASEKAASARDAEKAA